jgi:hypothetical protein
MKQKQKQDGVLKVFTTAGILANTEYAKGAEKPRAF